jgi:hypothetical protein
VDRSLRLLHLRALIELIKKAAKLACHVHGCLVEVLDARMDVR